MGFYSWLGSQEHGTDPRVTLECLASVSVPVLVLRPECDYVPEVIAEEYPRILSTTTFTAVPGGHLAYVEYAGPWHDAVATFLSNHAA